MERQENIETSSTVTRNIPASTVNREGAAITPQKAPQKAHRRDYGRGQSVTKRKGSVNESQTDKLCHSEADNTVLTSIRGDSATRSLCGYIKSQPEGLQRCIAEQRVPDHCKSVEKLHEFLPDCEKCSGPSQHLQVTQWMASIDGKEKHDAFNSRMEGKKSTTTQASAKKSPNNQQQKFQHEK
ncbi:hypothetical protein O181_006650 [Austropuccinia psidii MF-1]|uniref:Uncharacterized protein n=1 Tax=Austropuccinia psidii MF-1 TaxID=1389203 RepID=A0A9Q3BLE7_9BASI|nr:hypothetical protein [Austropuccinia psidii MF-1]